MRKRDLHIITIGTNTFSSDDRFKALHPEDKDWVLEISTVTFRDAGVYECQVSTSPKISLPVHLAVEVQQAQIQGSSEVHIQNGSTISLTCIVNTHADNVGAVTWYHDASPLDYDSPRGGVSLEIEKTPSRTTSKLFITRAMKIDSGNYTCAPKFADAASVLVHVVNAP
ncbi:neurotrimin-like [Oratosquilla oratoria]|uniref:neurotrimin-like n=1 Tax=Oratosquilla oratoria TaxID=337810 RepID=UPI003F7719BE